MLKVTCTAGNRIRQEFQQMLEYKLISVMNNLEMHIDRFESAENPIRNPGLQAKNRNGNNQRKELQPKPEYR
jgi:hypothetical protein